MYIFGPQFNWLVLVSYLINLSKALAPHGRPAGTHTSHGLDCFDRNLDRKNLDKIQCEGKVQNVLYSLFNFVIELQCVLHF